MNRKQLPRRISSGIIGVLVVWVLVGLGVVGAVVSTPIVEEPLGENSAQTIAVGEEVVGLRTETSKTYYLGNGTYELRASLGAVHYLDEQSTWQDIDTAIVASDRPNWDWEVVKGHWTLLIAEDTTIALGKDGHWMGFRYAGFGYLDWATKEYVVLGTRNSVTPVVTGNSITWSNIFGGVDLEYVYGPDGFKENLYVSQAARDWLVAHPPSSYGLDNQTTYLVGGLECDWVNAYPAETANGTPINWGNVNEFIDSGVYWRHPVSQEIITALPIGLATHDDVDQEDWVDLQYRLYEQGGTHYLLFGARALDLNAFPVGTVILDPSFTIGASTDDCYVSGNNPTPPYLTISLTSNAQSISYTGVSHRGGGMRFTTVTIPKGATINTAYITFRASTTYSTTVVNSWLTCEAADSAATFSTIANYNARSRTSSIAWNSIPTWNYNVNYNSPSIVSIIQAVVNRGGWASGNALVVFWEDNSTDSVDRQAASWDNSTLPAPILTVTYTAAPPTVTTSACSDATASSLQANGEITDDGGLTVTRRGFVHAGGLKYALDFNGVSDYVEVPDDDSLDLTTAMTIEAWVKFGDFTDGVIVRKNGAYILYVYANNLDFYLYGSSHRLSYPLSSLNTETWYHIAVTFDSVNMKAYVNGVNVKSELEATAIPVTTNVLRIGREEIGNFPFNGLIDDIRIWNDARTQNEIQANMYSELVGTEAGLVGYWKLNEGALISDNFEWGIDTDPLDDSGGGITWTLGGVSGTSTAQIDTAQHYQGTRSARFFRDGTNSPYGQFSQTAGTGYTISFRVRQDDGNNAQPIYTHGNGVKRIVVRYYYSTHELQYYNGTIYVGTGVYITPEQWTLNEIKNIDWDAGTFDLYQGGVIAKSGAAMGTSSSQANAILLQNNYGTNSEVWYDNIRVNYPVEDSTSNENDGTITGADWVYQGWDLKTMEDDVSQTEYDTAQKLYSGSVTRRGQKLPVLNGYVDSLSFYLNKSGSPSGDVTFTVRDLADNVLATKVLGDASTLQVTATLEEATFTTAIFVNEWVRISVEYSGGDVSNYVVFNAESSDLTPIGYSTRYWGTWADDTGLDCAYVLGYTPYTYEDGSFAEGVYDLTIEDLTPETWYRVRAFAETSAGRGYGDVVTCQTEAEAAGYSFGVVIG